MHEKKKVKKNQSIKTHHQYAEKNVPLCMLYQGYSSISENNFGLEK